MNSPYKGNFKVTSVQGMRTLNGKTAYHDGLDLVGLDGKNIYSTADGVVEVASNADPNGFGWYVKIKKDNGDRYYYGHMSAGSIKVCVGQKVKIGDLLGLEGSTGSSTGSHCHYCIRKGGQKATSNDGAIMAAEQIGIPNSLGTYSTENPAPVPPQPPVKKTNEEIAKEVIKGLWGSGDERKSALTKAGYDYSVIQQIVNSLLNPPAPPSIKTGDKVKITKGAKTYDGGNLKDFVYQNIYDVLEIKGDRAVVGIKSENCVVTAVKLSDLIKN